jgi:ribose-phosphate pyrophosphokinase
MNSSPFNSMRYARCIVFSGRSNPALAAEICEHLKVPQGQIMIKEFSDGENWIQVQENVRGADVFVVQPTCTDKDIIELLLIIDALRRASAERITAVLPYYGYARQDRKDRPRMPISAKLIAKLIETSGADRVLALDLHAAQIQGFFDLPVDHLFAAPILSREMKTNGDVNLITVVSPDAGGVERARNFAKRLSVPLAILDKRREQANIADIINIIGDVEGRHCIVVDDIIDTAGTLVKGVEALYNAGASAVSACSTHGVLSGPAIERIENSSVKEVLLTNSIPLSEAARNCKKIRTVTVAPLLAAAISSIHEETSVSKLFD